jgi:hypothetical protein
MIKKIAIGVAVILVIILGLAAMQPDTFSVKRSIVIKAPPEKIAALITDFHRWTDWSPWEKLDPNLQRTFGGPASGVGSTYDWKGNKDVGIGHMEVLSATPTRVDIKLDFIEPFPTHNKAIFTLVPQGESTTVNWEMTGPVPYTFKIMTMFMSMDSMVGKDFEKGLAQMKAAAEK